MSNVMKTVDAKGMTIGRAQSPNQLIEGSNIILKLKILALRIYQEEGKINQNIVK